MKNILVREHTTLDMNRITIEKIRLKELYHFACGMSGQSAFETVAPISHLRALAHTKNPYAHPDDIVLLVAYKGNQCIGYHGLLPGRLKRGGHFFKIHWATTFFVAPEFRNKGIGKLLLNEIKKINIDFAVTRMTKDAQQAYQRMNFKPFGHLTYYQLRVESIQLLDPVFRAVGSFLEKKGMKSCKFHAALNRFEYKLYGCFKKKFYSILLNYIQTDKTGIECREVDQLKKESLPYVVCTSNHCQFYRGIEAINWMIRYRWVLSTNELEEKMDNYYFSQDRDIFKYIVLNIYSRNEVLYKGFLILSVSRNKRKTVIKLLDFRFQNPKDHPIAFFCVIKYAKKFLADRVEIPVGLANFIQPRRFFRHLIKKQKRLYLFYPKNTKSPLAQAAGNITFSYCDGDVPFT